MRKDNELLKACIGSRKKPRPMAERIPQTKPRTTQAPLCPLILSR